MICLVVLLGGCREEGDIQVKSITFEGVDQVDEGRLKSVLVTRESSWLPWGTKRFFDRSRFDADLKRIAAFYADRGFPDARVRDVDVQLNDDQDAVSITVHVIEGEPVIVENVRFEGFEMLPDWVERRLQRTAPLRAGEPLDRQLFMATRDAAVSVLRDRGYPHGTVAAADEQVPGAPKRVVAVYRAVPGPLAVFGPVEVTGHASVDDEVIRRELTFKPGDVYRRSELQESQRRLYNLELFEFANVEPQPYEGQPDVIPMRVTVAEGKHRRINFGVGYGTEEKGRVDTRWSHANFFGGARTAGVAARWSSLDRGVRLDFTQPYFLTNHLSLGVSGQAWNTAETLYSADQFGGRVTLRHQSGPRARNSWSVSFVNEYQRSSVTREALEDLTLRDELIALGLDPTDGTQEGTLVGFEFDAVRNTTGNLIDARRGYYAGVHLEQAGAWLPGNFNFLAATLDVRHYQTIARRAVLANRIQIGSIDGLGDETDGIRVPFARRFFVGGSTSVRGWGRFQVSPLSGAGLPIGGLSMLEMSSELRVPVWGKLSAVGFVDAGNAWSRPWQYELGDLRVAVGPGLRYQTPIGPVRVDLGYQLTPIERLLVRGEPEKRRWRVHFSIGQAF